MCLAVPAKVVLIGEYRMAQVDIHGVTRTVSLDLVPEAEVDSWVLIHAGFAISKLTRKQARQTLAIFEEMQGLG